MLCLWSPLQLSLWFLSTFSTADFSFLLSCSIYSRSCSWGVLDVKQRRRQKGRAADKSEAAFFLSQTMAIDPPGPSSLKLPIRPSAKSVRVAQGAKQEWSEFCLHSLQYLHHSLTFLLSPHHGAVVRVAPADWHLYDQGESQQGDRPPIALEDCLPLAGISAPMLDKWEIKSPGGRLPACL